MTRPTTDRRPLTVGDAAAAGFMMLSVNLGCAGIGAGLGALVGALVPLFLLGFFIGFGLGVFTVARRFRDL